MRDSARALAVEVVRRVLRGAFLSPTLRRALDASGLEGPDRSLVTDLSYGAVRRLAWLDAALSPRLRDPERLPERTRVILRLATYELLVRGTPRHAAVHSWVDVAKSDQPELAGLVNAVLRGVEGPRQPDAFDFAVPAWLGARFEAALGASAARRAALAMRQPAPLWLTTYRPGAHESLVADGCEVRAGPLEGTLRVRASRPLDRLEAFGAGRVQPQNPASAQPALLLRVAPGERVIDLAAGNGIKTAQLAAAGGRVVAVDVDPATAAARAANLARLGLRAEHVTADATRPLDTVEPAPAVLLDAPCTGTGTLRAHPEILLRLGTDDVVRAAGRQRAMLDAAAALTLPGGRLVYAVCSLTDLEGERQVHDFLERHAAFRPGRVAPGLPHVLTAHGAYLLPDDGLDGFFVALLRRDHDRPGGASERM